MLWDGKFVLRARRTSGALHSYPYVPVSLYLDLLTHCSGKTKNSGLREKMSDPNAFILMTYIPRSLNAKKGFLSFWFIIVICRSHNIAMKSKAGWSQGLGSVTFPQVNYK